MAEIRHYPFIRHLRADASSHLLHYRGNKLLHSGRGLSLWFRALTDNLVEIPTDDRELSLMVTGKSSDFQDLSVQGVITYRMVDAERLAQRVDFTLDADTGVFRRKPLELIAQSLSQMGQQQVGDYLARTPIRQLLSEGPMKLRILLETLFAEDKHLRELGLAVVSVRIVAVKPCPDLDKALETPMRELIKQEADEAAFQRRAMAVEKERAIQENEMQNRIELAKREENLIAQTGANSKRQAIEKAESERIALQAVAAASTLKAQAEADAQLIRTQAEAKHQEIRAKADSASLEVRSKAEANATRLRNETEAEGVRMVEGARSEAERARMEAYGALPTGIMFGLALKELAGKLQSIDHLNLGGDAMGPALLNLLEAGTQTLRGEK